MSINKDDKVHDKITEQTPAPQSTSQQKIEKPKSKLDELLNNRINKLQKYLQALGDGVINTDSQLSADATKEISEAYSVSEIPRLSHQSSQGKI